MTATAVLFWLVAGLTGGSALMVVLTQNIVRAAAWLLFTLAGTAALYFLLAADFSSGLRLAVASGQVALLAVTTRTPNSSRPTTIDMAHSAALVRRLMNGPCAVSMTPKTTRTRVPPT